MQAIQRVDSKSVSNFTFWLYLYFVVDFFLHLSARIPLYGMIRPTMILVFLITLALIFQKDRFSPVVSDPIFKAISILIGYIILTIPLVTWPGSVLFNNLPVFIKAVVFFFFTALVLDTEKRLKLFIVVFMACQTFRVLEPLYMNITSGYWGSATYLGGGEFAARLSGAPSDIINPNGLGFVVATIIPFWYYIGWCGRSVLSKISFLLIAPLSIYALVLTMSRGSFIAMLVVIWMILKDSKHKIFLIAGGLVVLLVIWANLSDLHKERYLSLVDSSTSMSSTAKGRIEGMKDELGVALERPIIGHGLGTSREAKSHAGIGWLVSHNLYIEILLELGLSGLIIFILFLRKIYNKFMENQRLIHEYHNLNSDVFINNLNLTMKTVFWMYVVFSFNYFGLSVYYWYMFGGLTIAFSRVYFFKYTEKEEIVSGS